MAIYNHIQIAAHAGKATSRQVKLNITHEFDAAGIWWQTK